VKIAVLATGLGNIRSVHRALERTAGGATITATDDPDVLRRADVLVVPGQGSFGAFARTIDGGLREVLLERIAAGTPYLGICLGLQVLFEDSEEAPEARGLGVLAGRVRRLAPPPLPDGSPRALPHMGWNRVEPRDGSPLLAAEHFYFAHSYAASPSDERVSLATTEYGEIFTSAVARDNVVGVQFHPEKSQRAGLDLVERFVAQARRSA
jgi:glutamine amidotransferase